MIIGSPVVATLREVQEVWPLLKLEKQAQGAPFGGLAAVGLLLSQDPKPRKGKVKK